MKEIKKIDNYKRIRIPVEFQNYLGWKIGDEIEVEIVGNDIILRKHESASDLNLELKKPIQEETSKESIELSNNGNEEDNYIELSKEENEADQEESMHVQKILDTLDKPTLIRNENHKIPTIKQYFRITSKDDLLIREEPINKIPKINLLDKKDELNNKLCPKCRQPIEDSRFKVDHRYICRNCRDKIKDKLCFEIACKKERLK